ncbi:MAG: hypothetical protein WA208_07515 [Thermoanaerobaculia bacterium]
MTLRGERTVIVDHALQQLTEIDRAASTYSITSFDAIARSTALAARNLAQLQDDAAASFGAVTALGRRHSAGGRPVDAFEIADPNLKGHRTQLAIDRSVEISRAALDVLLGAAYPGRPGRHHQATVTAATATRPRVQSDEATRTKDVAYGLPVEQHEEFDWEGRTLMRSVTVVRIGTETPPPEMLVIPPGARRVEPRLTVMPRALEELDRLPGRGNH